MSSVYISIVPYCHISVSPTTAFFVTVVLTVLLCAVQFVDVSALALLAHILLRNTGGLGRDAQAVCFIWAVHAVTLSITGKGGAASVSADELVSAACCVGIAQLITAIPAVLHMVTAGEEGVIHYSLTGEFVSGIKCFFYSLIRPIYREGMRTQNPLEQTNAFIWHVWFG